MLEIGVLSIEKAFRIIKEAERNFTTFRKASKSLTTNVQALILIKMFPSISTV